MKKNEKEADEEWRRRRGGGVLKIPTLDRGNDLVGLYHLNRSKAVCIFVEEEASRSEGKDFASYCHVKEHRQIPFISVSLTGFRANPLLTRLMDISIGVNFSIQVLEIGASPTGTPTDIFRWWWVLGLILLPCINGRVFLSVKETLYRGTYFRRWCQVLL